MINQEKINDSGVKSILRTLKSKEFLLLLAGVFALSAVITLVIFL